MHAFLQLRLWKSHRFRIGSSSYILLIHEGRFRMSIFLPGWIQAQLPSLKLGVLGIPSLDSVCCYGELCWQRQSHQCYLHLRWYAPRHPRSSEWTKTIRLCNTDEWPEVRLWTEQRMTFISSTAAKVERADRGASSTFETKPARMVYNFTDRARRSARLLWYSTGCMIMVYYLKVDKEP